ncbi:hypothetical protein BD770DRAFT_386790 [Pilaira anomala]|nr:hypothetical protein BD770DRAFT_386790 [Pilaira anomala]
MMNSFAHHQQHRPVCCGAIPVKIGMPLLLTIWIGISLYFASLSFMGKSPFYTYFNRTCMIVFGSLNTVFVVICLYGFTVHLVRRSLNSYRQYAKLLACCVAAILLDMFSNFVYFCVKKNDFLFHCKFHALNHFKPDFENRTLLYQTIEQFQIDFSCSRMFLIEALFSFACTVLMTMVYVYWVSFIIKVSRNFILRGPELIMHRPGGLVPPTMQEVPHDIVLT